MEKNNHLKKPPLEELLALRGQLRREIELAKEKGISTQPAKRKLAAVNKEIVRIKSGEVKGGLFDTQLDMF